MSHKYLNINDINQIEVLKSEGYSRRISKILEFHHSTISRELKRCKGYYKAIKANKDNEYKQSLKVRKTKITNILKEEIIDKLNSKWSPEQIGCTVLHGFVCFKTIQ